MSAPSQNELAVARKAFLMHAGGSLGAIILIHLLPKPLEPEDWFRLLCTAAYFAALLNLLWRLAQARSTLLEQFYEWAYDGCSPAMERHWKGYVYALQRFTKYPIYLLLWLVGGTAMATMALWFPGMTALQPLYHFAQWGSLLGLAWFLFRKAGPLLHEVHQNLMVLHREVHMGPFTPKRFIDTFRPDPFTKQPPFVVHEDGRFTAGEREWDLAANLTQNCIVFGQTGSGKTVCVLNTLLEAIFASTARSPAGPASGLILDPKGDFHGKIKGLCEKYGRRNDLLVLDPDDVAGTFRWNPLDTPDDPVEVAGRFAAVSQVLGTKDTNSSFWITSAQNFVRHSVALLRLTNAPGTPPTFLDIEEMARDNGAISRRADQLDVSADAGDETLTYFANEWGSLDPPVRSGIQATLATMISNFSAKPYPEVFGGRSTMQLADVIDRGKILYVHMPISQRQVMSRIIGTFIKLEYFRQVLQRPGKKRPSFFLCDEFHDFFTASEVHGDARFFSQNRQSNHANIIATQNLVGLKALNQQVAMTLLGNCTTKVFLKNTDMETNQYASGLFGKRLEGVRAVAGGPGVSPSTSDQETSLLPPEYLSRLATPSQSEGIGFTATYVHDGAGAAGDKAARKYRWKVHPL